MPRVSKRHNARNLLVKGTAQVLAEEAHQASLSRRHSPYPRAPPEPAIPLGVLIVIASPSPIFPQLPKEARTISMYLLWKELCESPFASFKTTRPPSISDEDNAVECLIASLAWIEGHRYFESRRRTRDLVLRAVLFKRIITARDVVFMKIVSALFSAL